MGIRRRTDQEGQGKQVLRPFRNEGLGHPGPWKSWRGGRVPQNGGPRKELLNSSESLYSADELVLLTLRSEAFLEIMTSHHAGASTAERTGPRARSQSVPPASPRPAVGDLQLQAALTESFL